MPRADLTVGSTVHIHAVEYHVRRQVLERGTVRLEINEVVHIGRLGREFDADESIMVRARRRRDRRHVGGGGQDLWHQVRVRRVDSSPFWGQRRGRTGGHDDPLVGRGTCLLRQVEAAHVPRASLEHDHGFAGRDVQSRLQVAPGRYDHLCVVGGDRHVCIEELGRPVRLLSEGGRLWHSDGRRRAQHRRNTEGQESGFRRDFLENAWRQIVTACRRESAVLPSPRWTPSSSTPAPSHLRSIDGSVGSKSRNSNGIAPRVKERTKSTPARRATHAFSYREVDFRRSGPLGSLHLEIGRGPPEFCDRISAGRPGSRREGRGATRAFCRAPQDGK
jgi:hypothetical protein